MSNRHRLSIEVQDETVRRAVGPETEPDEADATDGRSESSLKDKGVEVRSSDLRSVRAALNGWVRLVSVAEETERVGR
jgi:tRNA threonylcarbamoyladenosine modification (KEOPS) complex  Pcc1 subunit